MTINIVVKHITINYTVPLTVAWPTALRCVCHQRVMVGHGRR